MRTAMLLMLAGWLLVAWLLMGCAMTPPPGTAVLPTKVVLETAPPDYLALRDAARDFIRDFRQKCADGKIGADVCKEAEGLFLSVTVLDKVALARLWTPVAGGATDLGPLMQNLGALLGLALKLAPK